MNNPAPVVQPTAVQPTAVQPTAVAYTPPVAAPVPPVPAGVDPAMWARMAPEQQQAVLAAMGQTAPV